MPNVHRLIAASTASVLALALASVLWSQAATADPVAFIVAIKGRVMVVSGKGGAGAKAALGRPLERGDKVQVSPGGSASLFFSDGNVIELGGGGSLTVGGRLTAADKKRVGPGSEVSAEVFSRVSKFITSEKKQSGLVALAPMRGGAQVSPLILFPRRSATLTGAPEFRWRAVAGATRYRVTVTSSEGELWNREPRDTSLAYPEDARELAPDADYLLEVQALTETGALRREESTFHVMSEGEAAQVRDRLGSIQQAAGDTSEAAHYLAGSYLVGRGLYADAARHFEALCRLEPEAAGPHEALSSVYRTVGLADLAQAELERARVLAAEH